MKRVYRVHLLDINNNEVLNDTAVASTPLSAANIVKAMNKTKCVGTMYAQVYNARTNRRSGNYLVK